MHWTHNAVIYNIYPLGFCGARTCHGGEVVCGSYGKLTALALAWRSGIEKTWEDEFSKNYSTT